LQQGSLTGYTFAVKDVFAVKGHKNGAGNPDWLRTHEIEITTAPTIEKLLSNGAILKGLTHTDELMYSLNGENIHYGTPPNPLNTSCIPGGSSSGSASAAVERDFTIGTDTGGSVRVPSSYCGLYGIRPTHDVISLEGVIPLAASFDTVGWMSTSSRTLKDVGDILLCDDVVDFSNFYIDQQTWSFLSHDSNEILRAALHNLPFETKQITEPLEQWANLFREIQGIEIWKTHGEWITFTKPKFAPAIAERFQWASMIDATRYDTLKIEQQRITAFLKQQLGHDGVLVIPTTASVAPYKNASLEEVEAIRTKTMKLTCIAGLAGFPQVTVPVLRSDGLALGLSFIANSGRDRSLLHFVDTYFGGAK
ncbi:MAG: amidase, partial [Lysinibacillus sp.]